MPATVLHNKRETLARVETEYRALDRAVRALGSAALEEPVPGFGSRARIKRERWLRKDALVHIVEWKRQQLRALRKEPSDPALRGRTLDQKNRYFFRRWHSRPAREVVAYHRSVGRDIRKALAALGPEYFAKRVADLAERSRRPLGRAPAEAPRVTLRRCRAEGAVARTSRGTSW